MNFLLRNKGNESRLTHSRSTQIARVHELERRSSNNKKKERIAAARRFFVRLRAYIFHSEYSIHTHRRNNEMLTANR